MKYVSIEDIENTNKALIETLEKLKSNNPSDVLFLLNCDVRIAQINLIETILRGLAKEID